MMQSDDNCVAHVWPSDKRRRLQSLFSDVPVIGSRSRLWRDYRKMQAKRTLNMHFEQWSIIDSTRHLQPVSLLLGAELVKYFQWPNPFFFPQDVWEVLIWSPFDSLMTVDFLTDCPYLKSSESKFCNRNDDVVLLDVIFSIASETKRAEFSQEKRAP